MLNINLFKPIKYFGYFFILIGIAGLLSHFFALGDIRYDTSFQIFSLIVSIFHIILGIGVIFKNKWSFYGFKLYLYLLYLAVPIGTYIAIKTLKYIEKYDIENSFK